jgi:hypothetical protein
MHETENKCGIYEGIYVQNYKLQVFENKGMKKLSRPKKDGVSNSDITLRGAT